MLNYTNGFSCAIDNDKGDFIINFIQRIPKIEGEGIPEEETIENVSSVVMNKVTAGKLLSALKELLETEDVVNEED